jgi:PST family polysaccharide transporter
MLVKIASLNSASVLTRIATGLITSKVIALFVGPVGLALIGNLRDVFNTLQSFSTLGFYNGIVKYVSEFKNDAKKLTQTISSVFYLMLIATIIVALFCFVGAGYINQYIFPNGENYSYIIKLIAVAIPFYALNILMTSILNGLSRFKTILKIQIIGHVLSTCLTVVLIWKQHIHGALLAIVLAEILFFIITLNGVSDKRFFLSLISKKNISLKKIKKLSTFSIMALFTATIAPLVALSIRNYIIDTVSIDDAGFWEAMNRLSNYYLMFVSSLLTLYVLPRFSEINTKLEFRKEVFRFYKTIMPIFAVGLIAIYFLRHFIIAIVFSKEFQAVEALFFWQLLGDFIKVLSIVIAVQFLAKKMFWYYMITEALSVIVLYFSSVYLIDLYGVKGATMAHFITYVVYFVVILLIFSKSLFGRLPKDESTM